jgi:hypothetical protein
MTSLPRRAAGIALACTALWAVAITDLRGG